MAPPLIADLKDGILRIALNRPEDQNALDDTLVEALRQALERAAAEREAHAVLLRGVGPSFCAGERAGWLEDLAAAGPEEAQKASERLARLLLEIHRLRKPVVGRIHGEVAGAGVGLAAACDLAIAATSSRFVLREAGAGLGSAVAAPYLVRRIGASRALELALAGRALGCEEAAALGLVSRAVDETLLDSAVAGVLAAFRSAGPDALARSKDAFQEIARRQNAGPDEETVRWSARAAAADLAGDAGRAGISAFLDVGIQSIRGGEESLDVSPEGSTSNGDSAGRDH